MTALPNPALTGMTPDDGIEGKHPVSAGIRWSDSALGMWAKSDRSPKRDKSLRKALVVHLEETAAVTERLWDHWLSDSTKTMWGAGDKELLMFMAALHDIGKATPEFQSKEPHLCFGDAPRMRG